MQDMCIASVSCISCALRLIVHMVHLGDMEVLGVGANDESSGCPSFVSARQTPHHMAKQQNSDFFSKVQILDVKSYNLSCVI
eukprot:3039344-Amphidinium_carterae.1